MVDLNPKAAHEVPPKMSGECRPGETAWAMTIISGLVAAALVFIVFAMPPRPLPLDQTVPFTLSLCAMVLIIAFFSLRRRLEYTADGVLWRGAIGRRRVRWDQISDYYLLPGQRGARSIHVVYSGGTLRLREDWKRVSEFKDVIVGHETRCQGQAWEVKGARLQDQWPRRFRSGPWFSVLTLCGGLFWIDRVAVLVGPRVVGLPEYYQDLGLLMTVGFASCILVS